MKNLKKNNLRFAFLLLFIFASVNLYSQNKNDSLQNKLSVSVEMGTSIGNFNNSPFFTNYVIPSFHYPIGSRFSMRAGMLYSQSMYANNLGVINFSEPTNHLSVRSYVYTQGSYQVNDRLTIRADVIYGNNNFNSNYMNNFSSYSYSVGADFIISKNFVIGVQFRQTQNNFGNTEKFEY